MALTTIARCHGFPIKLQQVRDLLTTDGIGTNLSRLLTSANTLGFLSIGVKGPYSSVGTIPLPAIAHVTTDGPGHFVVIHSWHPDFVRISDRYKGVRIEGREEFCRSWSGYMLIVTPDTVAGRQLIEELSRSQA